MSKINNEDDDKKHLEILEIMKTISDDYIRQFALIIGPFVYQSVLLDIERGSLTASLSNDESGGYSWMRDSLTKTVRIVLDFTEHSKLLVFLDSLVNELDDQFANYLNSWLLSPNDVVERSKYFVRRLDALNTIFYGRKGNDTPLKDGLKQSSIITGILVDYIGNFVSKLQNKSISGDTNDDSHELMNMMNNDPIWYWISRNNDQHTHATHHTDIIDDITWLKTLIATISDTSKKIDSSGVDDDSYIAIQSIISMKSSSRRKTQMKLTRFSFIQRILVNYLLVDLLKMFNKCMDVYMMTHSSFEDIQSDGGTTTDKYDKVIGDIINEFMWSKNMKHWQFSIKNIDQFEYIATRCHDYMEFIKTHVSLIEWFNFLPFYHLSTVPSKESPNPIVNYDGIEAFEKIYDVIRFNQIFNTVSYDRLFPAYHSKSKINRMSSASDASPSRLNIRHLNLSQKRNTMLMLFGFMHDVLFHRRYSQVTSDSGSSSSSGVNNAMFWMGHIGNDTLKWCCTHGIKEVIYYISSNDDVSESSKVSFSFNRRIRSHFRHEQNAG